MLPNQLVRRVAVPLIHEKEIQLMPPLPAWRIAGALNEDGEAVMLVVARRADEDLLVGLRPWRDPALGCLLRPGLASSVGLECIECNTVRREYSSPQDKPPRPARLSCRPGRTHRNRNKDYRDVPQT